MNTINQADLHFAKALICYPTYIDQFVESLNYALTENPEHAQALCLRGRFYMDIIKDFRQAEVCFQDAIKFDPQYVDSYEYYLINLIYLGKSTEAIQLVNTSLKVTGVDRAMIYRHSAKIYELNKDYKTAIKRLRIAINQSLSNQFVNDCIQEIDRIEGKIVCGDSKDNNESSSGEQELAAQSSGS